jgi:hypothetical protein
MGQMNTKMLKYSHHCSRFILEPYFDRRDLLFLGLLCRSLGLLEPELYTTQ